MLGLQVYGLAVCKIVPTLGTPALLTWAWRVVEPWLPTDLRKYSIIMQLLDELDAVPLLLVLTANLFVVGQVYSRLAELFVRQLVERRRNLRAQLIQAGELLPFISRPQ